MGRTVHRQVDLRPGHSLTRHGWQRMCGRRITPDMVRTVLDFGRVVHTRGAWFHVVGRKEVALYAREGIDLAAVEGVHVVCSDRGDVITVYRNHDLSGLRFVPDRRRRHH